MLIRLKISSLAPALGSLFMDYRGRSLIEARARARLSVSGRAAASDDGDGGGTLDERARSTRPSTHNTMKVQPPRPPPHPPQPAVQLKGQLQLQNHLLFLSFTLAACQITLCTFGFFSSWCALSLSLLCRRGASRSSFLSLHLFSVRKKFLFWWLQAAAPLFARRMPKFRLDNIDVEHCWESFCCSLRGGIDN
jgi:hypothetical protein